MTHLQIEHRHKLLTVLIAPLRRKCLTASTVQ